MTTDDYPMGEYPDLPPTRGPVGDWRTRWTNDRDLLKHILADPNPILPQPNRAIRPVADDTGVVGYTMYQQKPPTVRYFDRDMNEIQPDPPKWEPDTTYPPDAVLADRALKHFLNIAPYGGERPFDPYWKPDPNHPLGGRRVIADGPLYQITGPLPDDHPQAPAWYFEEAIDEYAMLGRRSGADYDAERGWAVPRPHMSGQMVMLLLSLAALGTIAAFIILGAGR
jgi:hypothetical protein